LEESALEVYEYLEGYVERATFCGVLITGFIFNVISGILLYNNLTNRFSTVKDFLQKQHVLQLEEYLKHIEQDNGSRSQHESQYDFFGHEAINGQE
jgi:hypothetical protein